MKYIVISGGVISGIGKGITASSIGYLLKKAGLKVTALKIDPYFNVDAGMMSPYEHGEVYVLNDGTETDLDLGNYERFLGIKLTKHHSITSGKIFWEVINAERNGKYLGKTVQIMPHVTDHIKDTIKETAKIDVGCGEPDVCIIEVGGTVGDMESAHFTEAIRQLIYEEPESWCSVHVSLLLDVGGECKTKPTQNTIRDLRKVGIMPDFIVCRCNKEPGENELNKIGLMCQVLKDNIIKAVDVKSIYDVPICFYNQNVHKKIMSVFNDKLPTDFLLSDQMCALKASRTMLVGIIGKYTSHSDTYLSVIRAVDHASFFVGVNVELIWIDSSDYSLEDLKKCEVIIIPGGFGTRGIDGMINIAEWSLKNNIPTLGICLGFQVMAIVLARFSSPRITSEEFTTENTEEPLLFKKGDMKLGSYKMKREDFVGTNVDKVDSNERFRHRYHVVSESHEILNNETAKSFVVKHKFWLGVQCHPEFNSKWETPSYYFTELLRLAKNDCM